MSLVWPILAHLSAEPLVGLKRPCDRYTDPDPHPFSRTPRGFEALRTLSVVCIDLRLLAEPLVGLKPRLHQGQAKRLDFQPNPSWV